MNTHFNANTLEAWRRDGAVLMPSFFSAAEMSPVAQDFALLFSHHRPRYGAAVRRGGGEAEPQATLKLEELIQQAKLILFLPFDCSPALNLIGLHPALIAFAKAALESEDVRVYEYLAWPKFTGQVDFDQPFHMDYRDHTLTVPGDRPAERTVNFSIYASEVTDGHGAIHYVPRPAGDDVCGILRPDEPAAAQQAALRKIQRSGAGPIGSVFAYTTDVYHRATNLTVANGHRYTVFVSYKAAGNNAVEFTAWPGAFHGRGLVAREAGRKNPAQQIFEQATPAQLACLNVPPPGHPFWTEMTLARAQRRWPTWNLEPWRRALHS
jgi:hypothetical protein